MDNENFNAAPTRRKGKLDIPESADLSILTESQRRVVSFLLKNPGLTNKQIGECLGIATDTVGAHLSNANKRLSGEWEGEREKINKRVREWRSENLDKAKASAKKN